MAHALKLSRLLDYYVGDKNEFSESANQTVEGAVPGVLCVYISFKACGCRSARDPLDFMVAVSKDK